MTTKINSTLYYQILLENTHDYTTKEILRKLQKYTIELEKIVFPPPKDPLVKKWIDEGKIK